MIRGISHLLLLQFLLLTVLHAELSWESQKVKLKAEHGSETVKILFPFKNSGSATCEIVFVSSSCGCTVPKLEKKIYQTGENGQIEAIFTIGTRKGVQRKSLVANVKCGEVTKKYPLQFEVEIPKEVTLAPSFHFWKKGEEGVEKKVDVDIHLPSGANIDHVIPSSDQFDFRLEEIEARKKYQIYIKPKSTQEVARASFELKTDEELARTGSLKIYAAVK